MCLCYLCPLAATSKKLPDQLCCGGSPQNEPWAVKSQIHRMEKVGRDLEITWPNLPAQAGSLRALHWGLCPHSFWVSPRKEIPGSIYPFLGLCWHLLLFARKFLLRALFSLGCDCHRNISWGSIWGFLWLGRSTETRSVLRTGWIPAAAFCVGCQQLTAGYPKGMHSCLLQPDRCFSPFQCEWGLWSTPHMRHTFVIRERSHHHDPRCERCCHILGQSPYTALKKEEKKRCIMSPGTGCTRGHLLMWSGANLWS